MLRRLGPKPEVMNRIHVSKTAQNLKFCNPEVDESLRPATCLVPRPKRSADMFAIDSGPRSRLSLALVLISINPTDMKGEGVNMHRAL